MNFLHDDIVHILQNTIDKGINSATGQHSSSQDIRCSRSFKVTDFGTNRKLICDLLLMANTNLPPILYCLQVIADYWSNFR